MAGTASKPVNNWCWWYHGTILCIASLFCIRWLYHLPGPNKALLVLAGVAALMMLFEMHRLHKAGYIVLIGCLLVIENGAINKDRIDALKAESERSTIELSKFQSIADSIQESQRTMTGGDSFCYLILTTALHPFFRVQGKYPLHDVTVKITDEDLLEKTFKTRGLIDGEGVYELHYRLGDISPTGMQPELIQSPEWLKKIPRERDIDLVFTALNGFWSERICVRRSTQGYKTTMPDVANTSMIIVKDSSGKVLKREVDSDYPKDSPMKCVY